MDNIENMFEDILEVLRTLDVKFNSELLDTEEAKDMDSTIKTFIPKHLKYIEEGVSEMKKLNMDSTIPLKDDSYTEAFGKLLVGFRNTYIFFEEMDELLVNVNRKLLLETGRATLEDLKKPLLSASEDDE